MRNPIIPLLCLFFLVQPAQAAELFGVVDAVTGSATLEDASGKATTISRGDKVYVGQRVLTGTDGEVHIVTEDSGLIALRPDSDFRVDRYQAKGETTDEIAFSLLKGALRSITGWIAKRNPAAYRLHTTTATIGVRGTDHETSVIDTAEGDVQPGTYDTVYEGTTVMQTAQGDLDVQTGQYAFAPSIAGQRPILLARMPSFMARRSLRLEHGLQQRKENLHQRMQRKQHKLSGKVRDSAERKERPRRHLREQRLRQRQ